ncbi:hypothetical protein MLD38_017392 [Melastoma candidum]|uniref:Uncharacterized protein n=1 Tax=Melastoma candidum TaxID=119954 RepID=A0ACB9QR04_9MYRT|nr:hypothetical protein MLD38_017392 [Melastoma candidum]
MIVEVEILSFSKSLIGGMNEHRKNASLNTGSCCGKSYPCFKGSRLLLTELKLFSLISTGAVFSGPDHTSFLPFVRPSLIAAF